MAPNNSSPKLATTMSLRVLRKIFEVLIDLRSFLFYRFFDVYSLSPLFCVGN